MTANPLVAGPVDTSSALGGTMLVESLYDLSLAIESENWLATGLAGLSTVLDTAAAVMDPLGQLIAAGLGWLMEHVEPLKGWLNDLTGDAGAVLGFAGTWDNIATQMGAAAGDLDHLVAADLEGMRGQGVQAYVRYADDFAEHLRGLGASSTAVADSLRTCSTIVQVVHDLVRDALAEIVGAAISWAAQIVFTLGLGTPWVVSQVATRVSSLAARVGSKVTDVISSAKALSGLIDALKAAIRRLGDNMRGSRPGGAHTSTTPRVADLPVGDGSRRTLYDQMRDPHVHPTNADVVEPDYLPFRGYDGPEQFLDQFSLPDPKNPGGQTWDWPPHRGAVPGSEVRTTLDPSTSLSLDRIGGPDGTYFSPDGTPFGQRALPPDRLNFQRTSYEIDPNNSFVQSGRFTVERSEIAPWFGQDGGGVQYRFFSPTGKELTQAELLGLGIIRKVGS